MEFPTGGSRRLGLVRVSQKNFVSKSQRGWVSPGPAAMILLALSACSVCAPAFSESKSDPRALDLLHEQVKRATVPAKAGGNLISNSLATSTFITQHGHEGTDNFSVNFTTQHAEYGGKFAPVLLKESKFVRSQWELEGQTAALRVEMFPLRNGKFALANTLDIEADDTKFQTNYFEARKYGCCGALMYGRLYRYDGKKPFLHYNERYVMAEMPNSPFFRYAGFLWQEAQDAKEIVGNSPDAMGALIYARPEGTSERVIVSRKSGAKVEAENLWVSPLEFFSDNARDEVRKNESSDGNQASSITMWSLDKIKSADQISGLRLRAYLEATGDETSETLTVSVKNDHLTDLKLDSKNLTAEIINAK